MLECCFIAYLIFLLLFFFFWILYPGSGRNGIRNNFSFFSSSACLNPVWIEIMPEWRFLIFWFFLLFFLFLGILYPRFCWNRIRSEIFFLSFSAYLCAVWIEIMPEWFFLIFLILLLFFWEFFIPGLVGTKFGTKILLSLSWPISTQFG